MVYATILRHIIILTEKSKVTPQKSRHDLESGDRQKLNFELKMHAENYYH